MAFKNKLYPIHFYGRLREKCDGSLPNWPGIANEPPKFLAMAKLYVHVVGGLQSIPADAKL